MAGSSTSKAQEARAEIRKSVLALRSSLPKPYRLHKSAAICTELEQALHLTCAVLGREAGECTVAVYSAFEDEVQLDQFIQAAYAAGAKVAFPCMVTNAWGCEGAVDQTMEMREVSREAYESNSVPFLLHPLKKYQHESPDLEAFPYVPGNKLDMIVIPLVAFDSNRNRLGYGGGNYDRYLPQLSNECRQIAVAFTEQEVERVPVEEHDVPVTVLAR
jgi:5-formyltetrahydrofolate cyclo-ligase